MSGAIFGYMIGGVAPLRTVILVDGDGNEVVGVITKSEVVFTAEDSDVRKGKVYASENGVSIGTLEVE